jgi:hypothetical protein
LAFFGFRVEPEDVIDQAFEPWELDEKISDAALRGKVKDVTFGPFDNYSHALAVRQSYTEVNADALHPIARFPNTDPSTLSDWDVVLQEAAATLGVTMKVPRWYIAPLRI